MALCFSHVMASQILPTVPVEELRDGGGGRQWPRAKCVYCSCNVHHGILRLAPLGSMTRRHLVCFLEKRAGGRSMSSVSTDSRSACLPEVYFF